MRHVLLPDTPATAARRMGQATAPACLIASASLPLSTVPRLLSAAAGTVNLPAVATAADQHLHPAAATYEQPGRPFRRIGLRTAWTASAAGGILSRHACSAPCGARRRTRTWRFRSAPCLPSGRLSSAPLCARRCVRACGAGEPVDMWTTDNARALPTDPQAQQQQPVSNSIDLEGSSGSAGAGHRSAIDHPGRRFTSAGNCAIFPRILAAVHRSRPKNSFVSRGKD